MKRKIKMNKDIRLLSTLLFKSFLKGKMRIGIMIATSLFSFLILMLVSNLHYFPMINRNFHKATVVEERFTNWELHRYVIATNNIRFMMGFTFVPILGLGVGTFLVNFKASHLFKRMMLTNIKKHNVYASFFLFGFSIFFITFLFFTLLNAQWISILLNYWNTPYANHPFLPKINPATGKPFDVKFVIGHTSGAKWEITVKGWTNRFIFNPVPYKYENNDPEIGATLDHNFDTYHYGSNVFNIWAFLATGFFTSIFGPLLLMAFVGPTSKESTFTMSIIVIIFILPFFYAFLGIAIFVRSEEFISPGREGTITYLTQTPYWFSALFPFGPLNFGNAFANTNPFDFSDDKLQFVTKQLTPALPGHEADKNIGPFPMIDFFGEYSLQDGRQFMLWSFGIWSIAIAFPISYKFFIWKEN